jgi:hypothetical protein
MNSTAWLRWFSVVSVILISWGVVFTVLGLGILPIERKVLLPWESALYGAIMIGWGTTLFFVGRIALRRHDAELIKALLSGLVVWLVIEAAFSARFGVWFNVGVDVIVLALFSVPLIATIQTPSGAKL